MSQFTLKLIALAAMLLDHLAKTLLTTQALSPLLGMELAAAVNTFMLVAGRMAFPIFAWFAAEGCRKSRNPGRYLLRLVIFALLSEIPFQLVFYGTWTPGFHNVIFTILLAAAAICGGRRLTDHGIPEAAAKVLPAVLAVVLGWVLQTDYNAWGVALILGIYYVPRERGKLLFLAAWVTVFQLIWHGMAQSYGAFSLQLLLWIGGMFAAVFLAAYNGNRGRGSKWLFYIFYPVHLLAIWGLMQIL